MRSHSRVVFLAALLLLSALALKADTPPGDSSVPLSLDEAVRRASTASVSVRSAAALAESAEKQVQEAAAAYLPTISASVSGAWLANPPVGVTVAKGSLGELPTSPPYPLPTNDIVIVPNAENSYFKGNVTLSQPIIAWGTIGAGVELAKLEARMAALGLSGSRLDAERDAKRSYDAALLARDSVAVLNVLRSLAASDAADAEKALVAGTTTKAAVLLAESRLSDLDSRLVDAEEGEKSAMTGLAILARLGDEKVTLSSALRDSLPPLDETKILAAALASSTEGGEARVKLSEATRKLDLERGRSILRPDIAAFASLDASGQTPPNFSTSWMDSTWAWDLSIGLDMKMDIFDGGASMARTASAKASLAAARIGVEGADDSVRLAVRDGIAAARKAAAAVSAKAAQAAWAIEALRSAKVSLDAGMLGRPDYNAAAMAEASARLDLLSARYVLSETVADLERLAGGTLP